MRCIASRALNLHDVTDPVRQRHGVAACSRGTRGINVGRGLFGALDGIDVALAEARLGHEVGHVVAEL
jgi:hypothetical protein